jgi:hypothetical protein
MPHRPTRSQFLKSSLALMLCAAALAAIAGCASSSGSAGQEAAASSREPAPKSAPAAAPAPARESTRTLLTTDKPTFTPSGTRAQSVPDSLEQVAMPAFGYRPGDLIQFSFTTSSPTGSETPVDLTLKLESVDPAVKLPVVFDQSCAQMVVAGTQSILTVPIPLTAKVSAGKPIIGVATLSGGGKSVTRTFTLSFAKVAGSEP